MVVTVLLLMIDQCQVMFGVFFHECENQIEAIYCILVLIGSFERIRTLLLGMGKGKPVDELDSLCKKYKDCQKCTRRKYGEDCVGETTKYEWEQM